MTHEEIFELVKAELKHAQEKHGDTFSDLNEMGVALADEVLEVAQAIENNDINGEHGVKQELLDVITVCWKALMGLRR